MNRSLHLLIAVALAATVSLGKGWAPEVKTAGPAAMDVTGDVLGAEPIEHVSIDFIRQGRRASAKAQLAPLPNQLAP